MREVAHDFVPKIQNWLLTQNIKNSFDTWHGKTLFLLYPRSHYSCKEHKESLNSLILYTFPFFWFLDTYGLLPKLCLSVSLISELMTSLSVAAFQE